MIEVCDHWKYGWLDWWCRKFKICFWLILSYMFLRLGYQIQNGFSDRVSISHWISCFCFKSLLQTSVKYIKQSLGLHHVERMGQNPSIYEEIKLSDKMRLHLIKKCKHIQRKACAAVCKPCFGSYIKDCGYVAQTEVKYTANLSCGSVHSTE